MRTHFLHTLLEDRERNRERKEKETASDKNAGEKKKTRKKKIREQKNKRTGCSTYTICRLFPNWRDLVAQF
jgi:hypothetical protein